MADQKKSILTVSSLVIVLASVVSATITTEVAPPTTWHLPKPVHQWTVGEVRGEARKLLAGSNADWKCLDELWYLESSWNYKASNIDKGGEAYGLPQAKPATKMNRIAKDWRTNPITQIKWGLLYIDRRYSGHPCWALKHERKHNWY